MHWRNIFWVLFWVAVGGLVSSLTSQEKKTSSEVEPTIKLSEIKPSAVRKFMAEQVFASAMNEKYCGDNGHLLMDKDFGIYTLGLRHCIKKPSPKITYEIRINQHDGRSFAKILVEGSPVNNNHVTQMAEFLGNHVPFLDLDGFKKLAARAAQRIKRDRKANAVEGLSHSNGESPVAKQTIDELPGSLFFKVGLYEQSEPDSYGDTWGRIDVTWAFIGDDENKSEYQLGGVWAKGEVQIIPSKPKSTKKKAQ